MDLRIELSKPQKGGLAFRHVTLKREAFMGPYIAQSSILTAPLLV
jgi:hypothetical protein